MTPDALRLSDRPDLKHTYEDLDALRDDRRRHEIIDGVYERFGVREYWIADPEIEVMRVYAQARPGFDRPRDFWREHGDVLASSLLPGFEVRLDRVFG